RAHAGHELLRTEGLRHVIVGADLEPDELVGLVASTGEHHDRHVRVRPEGTRHVEAVHLRKTEIENDEVGPLGARGGECRLPVVRRGNRESRVLEVIARELDDLRLVIDDEHPFHDPNPAPDASAGGLPALSVVLPSAAGRGRLRCRSAFAWRLAVHLLVPFLEPLSWISVTVAAPSTVMAAP